MSKLSEEKQPPTVRRVVTKLPPTVYVDLYAVKLRTGRSLQSLVEEAIQIVIKADRFGRKRDAADTETP